MYSTRNRVAAAVGMLLALAGVFLSSQAASAAPAERVSATACSTNVYVVVWPTAGVYDRQSQDSYRITTKHAGDRVTGPTGWGHVWANGYYWTKVWVHSVPGWREGWMRDGATRYVGCA
jgi:hypothetical protein